MDAFYGISSWIDVVHLWQILFFSINILTKLGASLKFHESSRLVDPLANPIELDAIYNHIPNSFFHEYYIGSLEGCIRLYSYVHASFIRNMFASSIRILDLIVSTCLCSRIFLSS